MKARILCPLLAVALGTLTALPAEAQRRQRARQQQNKPANRTKAPASRRQAAPAPQSRTAAADDTSLRTTRVVIEQEYKPEVRRAPRPEFTPAPPPADTSRVAQTYEVPQQTLYYTYRSQPLRPLALGADSVKPGFQNYLRFGGGNLSTVYGDLGLAALSGENYETAIHARHLSQSGDIPGQQTSLTGLEAEGKLRGNGHIFHGGVQGQYNRYRYYGFDQATYPVSADTLKQTYKGLRLRAGVENEMPLAGGWRYAPYVTASYYGDSRGASERGIAFSAPIVKDLDSMVQFRLSVEGSFYSYRADTISRGNNLLQIVPFVRFRRGGFDGHLALTPSFGSGNSWLLPDIQASYALRSFPLSVEGGWKARIQQNTFEELTTINPYLNNRYHLRQTRSDEIWAGLQTSFARYVSVDVKVSHWQWFGLPTYTNNYGDMPDGRMFDVAYDPEVRAVSLQAGMRYQVGEMLAIGGTGTWFDFYRTTEGRAWHQPGVRLKADAEVRPVRNLRVTAYVSVLDQIYAREAGGKEVKLPNYIDVGAGLSYTFIPRLGLFLQTSNLLNRRNERWRGYASYGLNIYGGLTFHF